MRPRLWRGFSLTFIPTQWYVGVWWWPVAKDLAVGVNLGPFSLMWTRDRYWRG